MQTEYLEEVKLYFNEPILLGFNLGRLIGYAEDEEDCYLIVNEPYRGVHWHSFVGGYTYLSCLKEQGRTVPKNPSYPSEIWTDFSRLDTLLTLNGCPNEKDFIVLGGI